MQVPINFSNQHFPTSIRRQVFLRCYAIDLLHQHELVGEYRSGELRGKLKFFNFSEKEKAFASSHRQDHAFRYEEILKARQVIRVRVDDVKKPLILRKK